MEHAPVVLSIGRQCMLHGYSVHCPSSKSPCFLKPDGTKIVCDVHAYAPYIRHREPTWAESAAAAPAAMNSGKGTAPKRARFADTPVVVGGVNTPAVPGAAEPSPPPPVPEDTSSDDGAGAAVPDGEHTAIPNTPLRRHP